MTGLHNVLLLLEHGSHNQNHVFSNFPMMFRAWLLLRPAPLLARWNGQWPSYFTFPRSIWKPGRAWWRWLAGVTLSRNPTLLITILASNIERPSRCRPAAGPPWGSYCGGRWLHHPGGRTDTGESLGHKQRLRYVGEQGRAHSREVTGVGHRCQGTELQAPAVWQRPENVPGPTTGLKNVALNACFAHRLLRLGAQRRGFCGHHGHGRYLRDHVKKGTTSTSCAFTEK